MCRRTALSIFTLASLLSLCIAAASFLSAPSARAQQTLGGITGTVSDSTGGVLAATTVTLVNDQTTLTRTTQTNDAGAYDFVNLPIGSYTLTYTHAGFQTQKIPSITVQGDRTATVNTTLKIGEVGLTTNFPTANFWFHPPGVSLPPSISPKTRSLPALPTSSPTRPSPTSITS